MNVRNEMRLGLVSEIPCKSARQPAFERVSLKPENAPRRRLRTPLLRHSPECGFCLRRQITIAHGRAGPQSEHGESETRATAGPLTTRSSMRDNEYLEHRFR